MQKEYHFIVHICLSHFYENIPTDVVIDTIFWLINYQYGITLKYMLVMDA